MNKSIVDKVMSLFDTLEVNQHIWTVSWDKPELIEMNITEIRIDILTDTYAELTVYVEQCDNDYITSCFKYEDLDDTFFIDKDKAQQKLERQWMLNG